MKPLRITTSLAVLNKAKKLAATNTPPEGMKKPTIGFVHPSPDKDYALCLYVNKDGEVEIVVAPKVHNKFWKR